MALSTISQFKMNCQSLSTSYNSDITDSQIQTVIEQADQTVKIDMSNLYKESDITQYYLDFNLLSQFKAAEYGLNEWHATLQGEDSQQKKYSELYNKLLRRLQLGKVVYKLDGTILKSKRGKASLFTPKIDNEGAA